jgi:4-hydroxybenzoyl-CoA reductase subunit beta
MMRLPRFRFVAPRTVEDAAAALAEAPLDTMLLAGGTDLLPNMKRRQQVPRTLVSLRHVDSLRALAPSEAASRGALAPSQRNGHGLEIGAGVTLTDLVRSDLVRRTCAGLWQAAAQVATPHLRNMGTIGGNLCLDTRCTYYDQTYEWRQAIGFCMKKAGDICWVATSSPRCLAVSSTDTAPMLQALGATVRLVSAAGERSSAVADLFANDGINYLTRRPDEILTQVHVPDQTGWRSSYWKLRRRGSFDFPVASAAVAARVDGDRVLEARVVLGAVASRPLTSSAAEAILRDVDLTDAVIASAADAAFAIAKPMDNTDFELVWRKRMVRTLVTCALRELRGDDVTALRISLARQTLLQPIAG